MYSRCAQNGSVQSTISINLYLHHHNVTQHYTIGKITMFWHVRMLVRDLHSMLPLSPHQISTKTLNHHAPLENHWPLHRKKKPVWDETSLTTMLFGVASWAGSLEPGPALATPPLVLMRNHHSPLHLNVSLQPRRRHNFAAYMGPLTSKRALLREK